MPLKSSFQASKYVHHSILLTEEELEQLAPFGVYVILGKIVKDPIITREQFVKLAAEGRVPATGFALGRGHFDFIVVPGKGVIARQNKPVIEIKPFAFMLSSDGKLLENVFGKGSVDFGIDFSYPMLFGSEEGIVKTKTVFKEQEIFDQIKVFKRKETFPAQFEFDGKRLNGSFRIGKGAVEKAKKIINQLQGLTLRGKND